MWILKTLSSLLALLYGGWRGEDLDAVAAIGRAL